MTISWSGTNLSSTDVSTVLKIPVVTVEMLPYMYCDGGNCEVEMKCQMFGTHVQWALESRSDIS